MYLGGGYPELFAENLEANTTMRRQIKLLGESGMPIYAECGGFMYLCRHLVTREGQSHVMAGVFPFETHMQGRLSALGYREIRLLADTPIGPAGTIARGHEFHYSKFVFDRESNEVTAVYGSTDRSGTDRGCPGWLAPAAEMVKARKQNSARMHLEAIIGSMAEAYRAGEKVVRLHSGDPSL